MRSALSKVASLHWNQTVLEEGHLRTAIGIGSFVLLTALGAYVILPLPWTPVPITLQTFFVLLSGAVLGARKGAISQVLYLAAGVAGAPIFAAGLGGPLSLIGPTAGYLLAFPVGAAIAGLVMSRTREGSLWIRGGGFMVASAVVLLLGASWLALWVGGNLSAAFLMGVAPFVPGAILKSFAVAGLSPEARRRWLAS